MSATEQIVNTSIANEGDSLSLVDVDHAIDCTGNH